MTIYRCPHKCVIGKQCFIAKTLLPINKDAVFLVKCKYLKRDLPITAGDAESKDKTE